MPTDAVEVTRVTKGLSRRGAYWLIEGNYVDGRRGMFQGTTLNSWQASLATRMKEISVVWKDGRYGKEIVWMEIPTE